MGDLKRHHECPYCGCITYEPLTGACTACDAFLQEVKRKQLEALNAEQDEEPILFTWNEGR